MNQSNNPVILDGFQDVLASEIEPEPVKSRARFYTNYTCILNLVTSVINDTLLCHPKER